jgi:hypothetical protein
LLINQFFFLAALLLVSYSIVSLLFALYFRLCLKRHSGQFDASVTLILPLTGLHNNFKKLLYSLERQTLRPHKLIVTIESESDPAYALAKSMVSHVSFPVTIVIAGLARESSQKCHNLVAALKTAPADDGFIVLMDADISPAPWWLAAAVKPLLNKQYDIVSGYRWQMPSTFGLGEHLLTFIDRSIAITPRPPGLALLWGGTIAMSCSLAQTILAKRVLHSTLSDDLSIAEYASNQQLKILNRRILLVPSIPSTSFLTVWRFTVRQLQIIKVYRPHLWKFEWIRSTCLVICWVVVFSQSDDEAHTQIVLSLLLFLLLLKQLVLLNIGFYLGDSEKLKFKLYQCGLIFFRPLIDFYLFCALCVSIYSTTVTWSHITYLVLGPNKIKIQSRQRDHE